jgi:hypothetical protein
MGWEYVIRRLGLGHSLKACYNTLTGDWSAYCPKDPRVSETIRGAMARLLFDPEAEYKHASFHLYRDAWTLLVEMVGTKADTKWQVVPLVEAEARALYAEAMAAKWSVEDTKAHIRVVQSLLATRQREEAESKAKAKRDSEAEAAKAAILAKVDTDAAQKALADAEKALVEAKAEDKAALTEAMDKARKEVSERQQTEIAAINAADSEAKARVKAEAENKAAQKAEQRALEKARDKADAAKDRATERELKAATSGPIQSAQPGMNPGSAKAGTPKDVAAMMFTFWIEAALPRAVFDEFVAMVKASGRLHPTQVEGLNRYDAYLDDCAKDTVAKDEAKKAADKAA